MSDLTPQIEADAAKAKMLRSENFEQEQRPLTELIAADRYLASKAAAANVTGALKGIITRMVPPGGH